MEHLSKLYIIIYGLVIFVINGVCTHPIPKDAILSHNSENSIPFNIDSIIIVSAVFICTITLLVGCLCCHRNVFKVLDSVNNGAAHDGYVNANLGTEFTIFPPRGGSLDERGSLNDVKFEPLPDIRPRGRTSSGSHRPRPACFCTVINRGLPVEDWFEDPSSNFPRNQLQYLQEFGSGWFGQVVEGEAQGINRNAKKNKVVVKILRDDATPTDQIYFLHEVKAFRDLDHPNVMKLLGKCLETDPFLIILEHCAFKDLKTYLIQHRTESESLIQGNILLRMICNIASGLSHMHKKQFVHTDLAVRNCLVTNDLQVKIGDYGNSIEKFKDDYYCATDMAVPIRWCSPESLRCTETTIEPKEVTPESNIWSFGVVMWEVLEFAKLPYTNLNEEEVLQKVVIERFLTLKQPLTACAHKDKIYQVMQLCWLIDPKLRPSMDKVHSLMTHLYTYCNASSKTPTSDFEARWNALQPRTNARLVNVNRQVSLSAAGDAVTNLFESDFTNSTTIVPSSPHASALSFDFASSPASNLSPSLQNLRGSLDDLNAANNNKMAPITLSEQTSLSDSNLSDTTSSPHIKHIKPRSSSVDLPLHISGKLVQKEFDQWLASQQSKGDEESNMARQISEAIVTLDAALADENCTSSESNHTSPERDIMTNNDHDEPDEPDSLSFEPITELVKEKSASVQDFLTLTIIDSDNSDTDLTSPSAMNISDEGASTPNMLTVVDNVNCDDEIPINDDEFNTDTLIEPSAFSLTPSNTSTKLNCETDADSTLSNFRSNMDDCDDERMTSTPVRDDDDAGFTNVEMDSSVVWHSAVQTTGSSGFETAVCEAMSTQSDFGKIKMAEMEKCGEFVDGRGEECDRLMSIHCTQCRDEIDRLIEDLVDKESLVDKKKMADFGDGIVDDDREDFKSFSVGEVERDNLVGFVESEDLTRNLVDFGQSENMKISFDDFVQSEDIKVSFDDFDQSEDKASFDNFGQSEDPKTKLDDFGQSENKKISFDDFSQSEDKKISFDDSVQSEDKASFDNFGQSEDRKISFDDFGQSEDKKISFDDLIQSEDKASFDNFGQSEDKKINFDDFGQSEYPKTKLDDFGQTEDLKTKLDDFGQSEDPKTKLDDFGQSEDPKTKLDDFGQSEDPKTKLDDFGQSDDPKTKLDDFGQSEDPKTKLDDFGQSADPKTKLDDFGQSEEKKLNFYDFIATDEDDMFDFYIAKHERKNSVAFEDTEKLAVNVENLNEHRQDLSKIKNEQENLLDLIDTEEIAQNLKDITVKRQDITEDKNEENLSDLGVFQNERQHSVSFGDTKDGGQNLDDFNESEDTNQKSDDVEDDVVDFRVTKHDKKHPLDFGDFERIGENLFKFDVENEQQPLVNIDLAKDEEQHWINFDITKNEGENMHDFNVAKEKKQDLINFTTNKDGGENLNDLFDFDENKSQNLVDFGERIIENNGENDVCEAINSFVMIADTSDKLAPLAHEEDTSSGSTMYEVEDIDDALLELDEEDERSENEKLEESDALHSSLSESTSKFSQLELKFVSEENEEEDTFLTVDDIFEAEDYNDASTTPVISNMSNEKNQVHLIPDDNDDEDDDVLVVDTETNEIMMFQNDKLPPMTYTYQAFSELAPKIVWEDEAVNSGGKIVKNAVDSNVDVSWDEVNGPVASTSTSSLDNNTKSIFMWPGSSDEDDDEVGECNKVDLELPRPMAPEPDYSPDWESESDTNSDESSSSSTSGEFDCSKSLDVNGAKSASVDDVVLEVNGENDDEKSGASVRVSTWDKDATPKRSSLKLSPEKKSSQERKSVSFEIAQNPFVYEYPKEKRWDDPPPQRSMWSVPQLQQKQHINYTDWELSADDICDDIVEVEDFDDQANASSTSLFKLNDQLLYRLSDVPLEDFDAEDTNQVAFVDPLMGPITYRELFEHYRSSRFYPPPYDESLQDADSWLTASDDFSYSPSENAEGSSSQILHRSPQMKDDDEFIRLIKSDNTKTEELEKQIVVSETQGAINVQENGNLLSVNNNNNNNNNNSPERNQKNCNQELLI